MLKYTSFKGRTIDLNKKVTVYKNLHNGKFSIRQNGLVVCHADNVILKHVSFVVNQSGRNRVILESKKNVHAFVKGFIHQIDSNRLVTGQRRITYNPYKFTSFVFANDNMPAFISDNDRIYMDSKLGLFVWQYN